MPAELPTISIFDTLTSQKRDLEPLVPGEIGMYVCGLTSYDLSHIGHARTFMLFDVIRRYLAHRGYRVRFVRNHTDVDDKIIRRAAELGEDPLALSRRFSDAFDQDMASLETLAPDLAPRVSQEIPTIIAMIEKLVERGHAYVVEGDVFFEVGTFPPYGKLSKRNVEDLRAGERVEVDERKRHPADFALWKSVKPGEPSWDSPWGPGRPGWHIECSAMSCRHLGETFDIHGGGRDLVFPHHENEIAQAEGATGKPFARIWMHVGPLKVGEEKMGKSLGNFWTVRDALQVHHPAVLRFFNLTAHYRKSISYTPDALEEVRLRVVYILKTAIKLDRIIDLSLAASRPSKGNELRRADEIEPFWDEVHSAMDDDFNTPRAIAAVSELVKLANELMPPNVGKVKDEVLLRTLVTVRDYLRDFFRMLGLFEESPPSVLRTIRDLTCKQRGIEVAEIDRLVAERTAARANKDFARADEIRDLLAEKGIGLMDGPGGTEWEL